MDAHTATTLSAAATAIYAAVSAVSLLLLSRQIADARRYGAAPALYSLMKEMEEHAAAVRRLPPDATDVDARETILGLLEFFERVEHLRRAGVLPARTLRDAFGPVLAGHLADARVRRLIEQDLPRHEEVLSLATRLGEPPRQNVAYPGRPSAQR